MSRWYGVAREPPETDGLPDDGGATAPSRPPAGSSGFTLVELLIAMVLAGIVGGAIVQLLLSQNEFYTTIDDRAFTEHSLRASAELLNRELRAVAPEDIVSADAGQLTVYQDSLRAVVCKSGDPVYAYVYHRVSSPRLESGTIGTYYRNVETGSYEYLPSFKPSVSGHPVSECENEGAPAGRPDEYYMSWDWPTSPGPPPEGAVIRIFGEVTYSIEPSDFGEGHALWRNGQELVGPFTSESEFRYRMEDGTVTTNPGTLADVRSVIVEGRLRESERSRGETRRALNLDITLRNRVGS